MLKKKINNCRVVQNQGNTQLFSDTASVCRSMRKQMIPELRGHGKADASWECYCWHQLAALRHLAQYSTKTCRAWQNATGLPASVDSLPEKSAPDGLSHPCSENTPPYSSFQEHEVFQLADAKKQFLSVASLCSFGPHNTAASSVPHPQPCYQSLGNMSHCSDRQGNP